MAADGWEFGLHAPIYMRDHAWAFREAREWLEQRIGQPVTGMRHHYFALDWKRPYESHRMHAAAGFTYDSSIAFRDAPGFRTGPHRAFDPVRNEEIPLLVLPCNLMGGHLLSEHVGVEELKVAKNTGREVLQAVRQFGGVAVFNRHQESAFNRLIYNHYIDVLNSLLCNCLADTAWITTPEEVCEVWNRRRREFDESEAVLAVPLTI
jgi:hypothetical protein